jgi:LPS sulfotransferase NodH
LRSLGEVTNHGDIRRILAIASVQRTGSTLLCSILRATEAAGHPIEILNLHADNFTRLREEIGEPQFSLRGRVELAARKMLRRAPVRHVGLYNRASFERYLHGVAARHVTPNGVFGLKVHWNQLVDTMLDEGRDVDFWGAPVSWVRIRRSNEIRQAISYVRAAQTESWNSWMQERGEATYDEAAIVSALQHIDAGNRGWEGYFTARGITPLNVSFDDLVRDRDTTVRRVMTTVGVELDAVPAPTTKQQSDTQSADWERRFLAARPEYASRAATLKS